MEGVLLLGVSLLVPVGAIWTFSRLSGWRTLAERYPLQGAFPPPATRFGYGVFRGWIGYNGGIVIASDPTGLYLRAMPVVLSFCHAPIYIPWAEITGIERRGGWLGGGYCLRILHAPETDFALRPPTFERIRMHAKGAGVPGRY